MAVPLLDLSRQYAYLKPELDKAVIDALASGAHILGPPVKELEQKVAKLSAVKYGCGVGSGTDALLLALKAAGIGVGDEVITTNFSFFATAGVIARLGAKPVLVDIEPDSYNIDPNLIEAAITDKTKAIIPVHLFGQLADMDPIMKIAKKHNLIMIEDAAQAIGAEYKNKPAGSFGAYGCFSFYPSKNIGAAGDGGMIVCNDDENADMVDILRLHGAKPKYYHKIVGFNSRLASMQAAVLLVKLNYLRKWSETRIKHANYYTEKFSGIDKVITPVVKDYTTFHIYNQYTIEVANRDAVLAFLREKSIGAEIYYPVPFHKQECFAYLGHNESDFPVSSRAADRVLSIPIYPDLTRVEQDEVIECVTEAVNSVG